MTPATTAGASKAARKSKPAARTSQAAKKAATTRAAGTSKKKALPPAGPSAGARKAKSPAAKVPATKVAARPRAGATSAGPAKTVAGRAPAGGARQAGASRAGAAQKTTKAVKKPAAKGTVNKDVTPASRTAKEKRDRQEKKAVAAPPATAAAKPPRKAATSPGPGSAAATGAATAPAPQKKTPSRRAPAAPAGPYAQDEKFLAEQRQLLQSERVVYLGQASDLKAEADSLAQEREPGDVQFDEESGEGGTVTVDRERDLALSAQALAAVEEIDAALAKIGSGTYGACERCQQPIPKPRLKALPYARLCVACKSGGLSRR